MDNHVINRSTSIDPYSPGIADFIAGSAYAMLLVTALVLAV